MKLMATIALAMVSALCVASGAAQTSTIPWHETAIGFAVSSSPVTTLTSIVGQNVVGMIQGKNTTIVAGFLADTLLRRTVVTAVEEGGVPTEYTLEQNYPNPFNPSTTIRFGLPRATSVSLRVYNLLGQETVTLIDEEQPAGVYDIRFDASELSSGVYIYRLQAGDYVAAKRLTLLR